MQLATRSKKAAVLQREALLLLTSLVLQAIERMHACEAMKNSHGDDRLRCVYKSTKLRLVFFLLSWKYEAGKGGDLEAQPNWAGDLKRLMVYRLRNFARRNVEEVDLASPALQVSSE